MKYLTNAVAVAVGLFTICFAAISGFRLIDREVDYWYGPRPSVVDCITASVAPAAIAALIFGALMAGVLLTIIAAARLVGRVR